MHKGNFAARLPQGEVRRQREVEPFTSPPKGQPVPPRLASFPPRPSSSIMTSGTSRIGDHMEQRWIIKVQGSARNQPDMAALVQVVLMLAEQLQRGQDEHTGDRSVRRVENTVDQ